MPAAIPRPWPRCSSNSQRASFPPHLELDGQLATKHLADQADPWVMQPGEIPRPMVAQPFDGVAEPVPGQAVEIHDLVDLAAAANDLGLCAHQPRRRLNLRYRCSDQPSVSVIGQT